MGTAVQTTLPRRVTREELYEMVWSSPMRDVAREFGVSDVTVAKACRRLSVPRPERGYWQRLRAGHEVRRRALRAKPADAESDTLLGGERHVPSPAVLAALQSARAKESAADRRIEVRAKLGSAVPIVKATAASLREHPVERDGMLQPRGSETLDMRVSKGSMNRALLIFDALIRALDKRDLRVNCRKWGHWRCKTVAGIGEDEVEIRIEEAARRLELPATERRSYDRYRLEPTGALRLRLGHYVKGVPKTIADSKTKRLEERLNEAAVAILAAVEGERQRRLEREEWRRQWEEERARAEELKRQQALEAERRRILLGLAARWEEVRRTRAFLASLRDRLGVAADAEAWTSFFAWADGVLEDMDPLGDGACIEAPAKAFGAIFEGVRSRQKTVEGE